MKIFKTQIKKIIDSFKKILPEKNFYDYVSLISSPPANNNYNPLTTEQWDELIKKTDLKTKVKIIFNYDSKDFQIHTPLSYLLSQNKTSIKFSDFFWRKLITESDLSFIFEKNDYKQNMFSLICQHHFAFQAINQQSYLSPALVDFIIYDTNHQIKNSASSSFHKSLAQKNNKNLYSDNLSTAILHQLNLSSSHWDYLIDHVITSNLVKEIIDNNGLYLQQAIPSQNFLVIKCLLKKIINDPTYINYQEKFENILEFNSWEAAHKFKQEINQVKTIYENLLIKQNILKSSEQNSFKI